MPQQMTTARKPAEVSGGPAFDVDKAYWDLFAETAARYPANEAVVSLYQTSWVASDEVLRWTYGDLLQLSKLVSLWFQGQGCSSGTRLAAFLDNSAEWVLFLWVAARMGLVFIPLDRSTLKTDAMAVLKAATPAIVVVEDEDAARAFDEIAAAGAVNAAIRVTCSATRLPLWTSLRETILVTSGQSTEDSTPHMWSKVESGPAEKLILFTSGTTGYPKGCPLTSSNVWSQTWDWEPPPEGSFDRWLAHIPVFHIWGCNHVLRMFRYGGTVVFSGKRFDPSATFAALKGERCTKMAVVPTMARALLSGKPFGDTSELALHYITLGGTAITPDDIRLCKEGFGAKSVVQGYGLSEGMPMSCWDSNDPLLTSMNGYHRGVGKAVRGANLRVCEPRSSKVLLRNDVGELHVSGPSVINGYLCGLETDAFYKDGPNQWFKTGDQASIDDDDVLHIFGRYKDLVIRGGKNISPAKVEMALSELPGVSAQVVGCPDDLAGEVPVAVLKTDRHVDKTEVIKRASALGPMYALDAVYFLSELLLESFPVTPTGKIRKSHLREIVLAYRDKQKTNHNGALHAAPSISPATGSTLNEYDDTVISTVMRVWEEMSGVSPNPDTSVLSFADSITILRFCSRIHGILNVPFYLQDIQRHKTAQQQAELLEQRRTRRRNLRDLAPDTRFSLETVVFANGNPSRLADIQLSTASILEQVGLLSSDIEAHVPIPDALILSVTGTRPQSFHHRFVVSAAGSSPTQVREAIEACVSTRQTFRSLLGRLEDGTPYHIVMKPSYQFFKLAIQELEVDNVEACNNIVENDDSLDRFPELLMFQARIITCQNEPSDLRVVFDYNHSAFDMLTVHSFYHDIDTLLGDPNAVLPELTPYKRYADTTYLYRNSLLAANAVNYHVSQINQVIVCKQALWPPQRAPGWMVGRDRDSALFSAREAVRARTWARNPQKQRPPVSGILKMPSLLRKVACPALQTIQSQYGVPPKIVLQAALKLFNVLVTRQAHGVLGILDDARSWPFVPEWMADLLPPAASIAGPTFEVLMSVTRVDLWCSDVNDNSSSETVEAFLKRVHQEWEVCRQHAHAPWSQIRRAIDDEHGELDPRRQMSTWDASPTVLDSARIKIITRRDWPDCGVFWNGMLLDKSTIQFYGSWDTAQMNEVEFEAHCDLVALVLKRMTESGNLTKPLRDVFLDLTQDD